LEKYRRNPVLLKIRQKLHQDFGGRRLKKKAANVEDQDSDPGSAGLGRTHAEQLQDARKVCEDHGIFQDG